MSRALAPAAAADYASDTVVFAAPDAMASTGRGPRTWWVVAAGALVIAGAVTALVVVTEGDDLDTAATSVPAGPAPTTSPVPTVSSTTTTPTTTVATTVPVTAIAPESPASAEQLIAVYAADPARYGPATPEVIDRLGGITNRGRRSRDRRRQVAR